MGSGFLGTGNPSGFRVPKNPGTRYRMWVSRSQEPEIHPGSGFLGTEPETDTPTSQSWILSGDSYGESDSFSFLLTNANGNPPTKFPHNKKSDYGLGHHSGYGPVFGDKGNWDLYISSESNANATSGCQLTKNSAYLDILRLEEATFTGSKIFKQKKLKFSSWQIYSLF